MIGMDSAAYGAVLKQGAYLVGSGLPSPQLVEGAAACIADEIGTSGGVTPKDHVRNAVRTLNARKHFDLTRLVAQAWYDICGCDPVIQKHLSQALIELGALDLAHKYLEEAAQLSTSSQDADFAAESIEYQGLLGRVRKQMYVERGDRNLLREATDAYLQQYARGPDVYWWHGINVLALRILETRVGLPAREGEPLSDLAHRIFDRAKAEHQSNSSDPWPLATASEACLGLSIVDSSPGWCEQAELWLHRFLTHESTTPFMTGSYYRQLREIWSGSPLRKDSCADRLASILNCHMMNVESRWCIDTSLARDLRAHPEELEKNFSSEKTFSLETLRRMVFDLAPNIGCVVDAAGARKGTGFLLRGEVIGLPRELVFVTNAHVISESVQGALKPAEAGVTFETEPAAPGSLTVHQVRELLFSSDPAPLARVLDKCELLDFTIVSLKTTPTGLTGLRVAENLPLPSPSTKVFVVGHPLAGSLQFSLNDTVLLDICRYERLMHYRTPTEAGSSGSPVFSGKLEVVAVHHAGSNQCPRLSGSGDYEANEGITLKSIQRFLKSEISVRSASPAQ